MPRANHLHKQSLPLQKQVAASHRLTSSLSSHIEKQLRENLSYYMKRAHIDHGKGMIKEAIHSFKACIDISKQLLSSINDPRERSGIELLFMASHNLAACYNQLHFATQAKLILQDFHEQVINLCSNQRLARSLRLNALSVLDKSLFSLVSQLAYMGQVSAIRPVINDTESLASKLSLQLGNDSAI